MRLYPFFLRFSYIFKSCSILWHAYSVECWWVLKCKPHLSIPGTKLTHKYLYVEERSAVYFYEAGRLTRDQQSAGNDFLNRKGRPHVSSSLLPLWRWHCIESRYFKYGFQMSVMYIDSLHVRNISLVPTLSRFLSPHKSIVRSFSCLFFHIVEKVCRS